MRVRVAQKEIHDQMEIDEILGSCHVGRLATSGRDGYPVIKPLNYAYVDGNIYFHSAAGGEKIDDIRRDERICFEVDLPVRYVKTTKDPCSASYRYRSVIVKGKARIVEGKDEVLKALLALMKKYQPEGGYQEFLAEKLSLTAVIRIEVLEMTGKEDLR
jgi:uncharacterized protein